MERVLARQCSSVSSSDHAAPSTRRSAETHVTRGATLAPRDRSCLAAARRSRWPAASPASARCLVASPKCQWSSETGSVIERALKEGMNMAVETMEYQLPRIRWASVFAGAFCAVAVQIVLGLFGAAFGFGGEGAGVNALPAVWEVLTPAVALFAGSVLAISLDGRRNAYLNGFMV